MARTKKKTDSEKSTPRRSPWQVLKAALLRVWNGQTLIQGDPKPPGPLVLISPYQRGRVDLDRTKDIDDFLAQSDALHEDARKEEALELARAELALTKESLQRNLSLVHRSVLVSMLTSVIALAALVVALGQPAAETTRVEVYCVNVKCAESP